MRVAVGLILAGFLAFLLVADETPGSFLSKLMVSLNGTEYARRVFDDRVPIGAILASYNQLPSDPDAPRCRVAVVELAAGAAARPPVIALIDQDPARFGGSWRPTPLTGGGPGMPDVIAACGLYMDGWSRKALAEALAEPGAFFIRDWRNATLHLYAPKVGLAAHLVLETPRVSP